MHEICIRVRLSDGQTSSLSLSLEGGQAMLDEGEGEIQNNDEDNSPNQLPFPSRSRQWEWCAGSTRTALSHAPARQKLCPLYCWRDGYLSVQEETPAFARSCCLSRQQHLKKERKKEKKTYWFILDSVISFYQSKQWEEVQSWTTAILVEEYSIPRQRKISSLHIHRLCP